MLRATRSNRAAEARERGMLTASEVAGRLGTIRWHGRRIRVTAAAVDALGASPEWHHSGWNWKETNYYSEEQIGELRSAARWVAILQDIKNRLEKFRDGIEPPKSLPVCGARTDRDIESQLRRRRCRRCEQPCFWAATTLIHRCEDIIEAIAERTAERMP